MAIYRSPQAAVGYQPFDKPKGGAPVRENFILTLSVALLTGDQLYLAKIPAGVTLDAYMIDFPVLDATATAAVGDTASNARYVTAAANVSAAGRYVSTAAVAMVGAIQGAKLGTLPFAYTATDFLVVTIGGVVAAGASSGTLIGWIDYTLTKYRRPVR
jgi:hypothetical protein